MATKYKLPESTVRRFAKSFKETQKENPNTDLEVVPKRKRGRPTLLPEEIDQKVMIMIKKIRESGAHQLQYYYGCCKWDYHS